MLTILEIGLLHKKFYVFITFNNLYWIFSRNQPNLIAIVQQYFLQAIYGLVRKQSLFRQNIDYFQSWYYIWNMLTVHQEIIFLISEVLSKPLFLCQYQKYVVRGASKLHSLSCDPRSSADFLVRFKSCVGSFIWNCIKGFGSPLLCSKFYVSCSHFYFLSILSFYLSSWLAGKRRKR